MTPGRTITLAEIEARFPRYDWRGYLAAVAPHIDRLAALGWLGSQKQPGPMGAAPPSVIAAYCEWGGLPVRTTAALVRGTVLQALTLDPEWAGWSKHAIERCHQRGVVMTGAVPLCQEASLHSGNRLRFFLTEGGVYIALMLSPHGSVVTVFTFPGLRSLPQIWEERNRCRHAREAFRAEVLAALAYALVGDHAARRAA